jgi:hypothetical protein
MPKINGKSFKFVKLVLLMLCVVIVFTDLTVGLVILSPQKSTPKEKDVNGIYNSLKGSIFLFKVYFELYKK